MRIIRNANDLADLAKTCRKVWHAYVMTEGGAYGQSQLDVLAALIKDVRREDIQAALELIDRLDRGREAAREEFAEAERVRRAQEEAEAEREYQVGLRIAQARSEAYAEGRRDTQRGFIALIGIAAIVLLLDRC